MDKKTKLILALMQLENIHSLTQDSEWLGYISSHLVPLKCEFERQLSNLTHNEKFTKI